MRAFDEVHCHCASVDFCCDWPRTRPARLRSSYWGTGGLLLADGDGQMLGHMCLPLVDGGMYIVWLVLSRDRAQAWCSLLLSQITAKVRALGTYCTLPRRRDDLAWISLPTHGKLGRGAYSPLNRARSALTRRSLFNLLIRVVMSPRRAAESSPCSASLHSDQTRTDSQSALLGSAAAICSASTKPCEGFPSPPRGGLAPAPRCPSCYTPKQDRSF